MNGLHDARTVLLVAAASLVAFTSCRGDDAGSTSEDSEGTEGSDEDDVSDMRESALWDAWCAAQADCVGDTGGGDACAAGWESFMERAERSGCSAEGSAYLECYFGADYECGADEYMPDCLSEYEAYTTCMVE